MHTKFEPHKVSPKAHYPFPETALADEPQNNRHENKRLSRPRPGPIAAPENNRRLSQTSGPIAAQSPTNSFDHFQRYRPSKSSPLASPTLEAIENAERHSVSNSTHSLTRTQTRDGSTLASPPSPRSNGSLTRPRLYQQVSESNPKGRLVLVRSISEEYFPVERPRPQTPVPDESPQHSQAGRIFESILDAEPREESGVGIQAPKRQSFVARLRKSWREICAQLLNRNG